MNRRSVASLVVMVIILSGFCSTNVEAELADQMRLKNAISIDRGEATIITFTQESRFSSFTLLNDHYLAAYMLAVTYALPSSYYSTFGFRRQDTEFEAFTSHENRVYMQGGRKQQLAERLRLDARGRIEYRRFREPILDDYFRFRIRFKLVVDARIAGAKLKPFISDELFADDRAGSREFLKRSRVIAGLTAAIGEHAGFTVSYMMDNDRHTRPLTALIAGIQIKM